MKKHWLRNTSGWVLGYEVRGLVVIVHRTYRGEPAGNLQMNLDLAREHYRRNLYAGFKP